MKFFKIVWIIVAYLASIPFISKSEKELITRDLQRWANWKGENVSFKFFLNLFAENKEYRTVVYYRLRRRFRLLPSIFLKGQTSSFICSNSIGEGLILIHGFSTIINAQSVGKDCKFFQQVTVGYSKSGTPSIGDNCVFGCGSIVLGNVKIGNNVIIGAGAVVTKDIPDNSIVTGNPCRVRPLRNCTEILDLV